MTQTKHISKGSFIFCIGIGIIIALIALFVQVQRLDSRKNCIGADAVIDGTEKGVTVTYTINNQTYNGVSINTLNSPKIGDHVKVYVDNNNYSLAYSDDTSRLLFTIFLILAIFFILSGTAALIIRAHMLSGVDSIVEAGHYIYADVDRTVYETSITDNEGRHPFIITCHYTNFKGTYRKDYKIDNVYNNPGEYLLENNNKIKIYIKGKNFKKYSIDPDLYVSR